MALAIARLIREAPLLVGRWRWTDEPDAAHLRYLLRPNFMMQFAAGREMNCYEAIFTVCCYSARATPLLLALQRAVKSLNRAHADYENFILQALGLYTSQAARADELEPGMVIWMNGSNHVALYLPGDRVLTLWNGPNHAHLQIIGLTALLNYAAATLKAEIELRCSWPLLLDPHTLQAIVASCLRGGDD